MGDPSQGFKVDITDLYMTAPVFAQAGSALSDAVEQATSQIERLGDFWGSDTSAKKFGEFYKPNQDRLLQLLAIVSGEISGISNGLNQTADTYKVAEESNMAKIRELNREGQ